jgi:YfiH family protein
MSEAGYPADWPAPPGVMTWQTTRVGGVSRGAYSSMNLGLHVGDDSEAVAKNRARLQSVIDSPREPHWLEQVHGNRILDLDRGETGQADGAVTTKCGEVLVIMTADCLPLLLASKDGKQIGVAHGGWRGLANGIVETVVAAFACEPAELLVWLGPTIGQDNFEVGSEVREAFVATHPESDSLFVLNPAGRWQADLAGLARQALARSGVRDVHGQAPCTFADSAHYFSHRREAPCGRMASLIWRES